jgi:FAD/FMN-containing dehydrogenase
MTTTAAPRGATSDLSLLDRLRRRTTGPVLLADDPGVAAEVAPFNTRAVHRPDVVVGAACADDVVAAVRFGLDAGLPVAVQATGHGAVDAVRGGVLVTTGRMDDVSIDPQRRVARVGAGAKWAQVIAAAAPYGLAPLSGSTSDVGAVGYTLGGGVGPLGRRYGFSADRVRSVELVTGDGRLRRVDADDSTGLFWGLRGGKGNLGIVTAIEVELVPVARFYAGGVFFAGDDAPAVLHTWRRWVESVPEEMTSSVALLRLPDLPHVPPPLRGRLAVHLRIAFLGSAEDGERLVAPLRAAGRVLLDGVRERPFTEADAIHMDPTDPMPAWQGGRLLSALPAEAVDALLAVAGPGVQVPLVLAELRHLGGALGRPASVANAVPGRSAAFSVFALGPGMPDLEPAVRAAVGRVVDALAPWDVPERLVNFLGPELAPDQVAAAYPPAVAARLQELKDRFDPSGLFRHSHTLRVAQGPVPARRHEGELS